MSGMISFVSIISVMVVLLVGEWSWRLRVDVAGADAMVEEKESAEFMEAGLAVTGWADLAVRLRGPLDECLADA